MSRTSDHRPGHYLRPTGPALFVIWDPYKGVWDHCWACDVSFQRKEGHTCP